MRMKKNLRIVAYLLASFVVVTACQEDNLFTDVDPAPPLNPNWGKADSIPIISEYYFRGKIDSAFYTIQDGVQSYENVIDSAWFAPCETDKNLVGQTTKLESFSDPRALEIRFLNCLTDTADSVINAAAIYEGTYPYGSDNLRTPTDGVQLVWTDARGTEWTSQAGTGAAGNFSFRILQYDTVSFPDSLSDAYIIGICDLYLYNGARSIQVEGGEFRLRLGKF